MTGPEGLDTEHLSRAIADAHPGAGKVTGCRVEELGAGKGQASRVVRIHPQYEGGDGQGPASIVGKFPSDSEQTLRLAELFRLYKREVGFYTELGSAAGPPVPRLYHSELDSGTGEFALLIEDVPGATAGDLAAGCSLDTAQRVVEVIGEMHARWWNSPELETFGWLPVPNYVLGIDYDDPVASDPWGKFLARTKGNLPRPILDLCNRLRSDRSVLDRLASAPVTLVHGDLRINNVMISDEGDGEVRALLDWQTAVRGRGPMDIASLFASSLQPDDRRIAEREILPAYHQRLVRHGVCDYTFDECWTDYRLAVANQFSQVVFLSSVLEVDERLEDGVSEATGLRLAVALIELEVSSLLDDRPAWRKLLSRAVGPVRRRLTRS